MVAFKDDEKRRNAEKKAEAATAKAAKGQVGRSPAGLGKTTRAAARPRVEATPPSLSSAEEPTTALSPSPCAILKKRKTGE
jgi:hypothetical protein